METQNLILMVLVLSLIIVINIAINLRKKLTISHLKKELLSVMLLATNNDDEDAKAYENLVNYSLGKEGKEYQKNTHDFLVISKQLSLEEIKSLQVEIANFLRKILEKASALKIGNFACDLSNLVDNAKKNYLTNLYKSISFELSAERLADIYYEFIERSKNYDHDNSYSGIKVRALVLNSASDNHDKLLYFKEKVEEKIQEYLKSESISSENETLHKAELIKFKKQF